MLLSHTVARVMNLLPWIFLLWFWSVVAFPLLPCSCCVIAVVVFVSPSRFALTSMTFALIGHHVSFQPLVTGPHLHPPPASSPPSSSSPSTLPSSTQSSVAGLPRFYLFFFTELQRNPSLEAASFFLLSLRSCVLLAVCVCFSRFSYDLRLEIEQQQV